MYPLQTRTKCCVAKYVAVVPENSSEMLNVCVTSKLLLSKMLPIENSFISVLLWS